MRPAEEESSEEMMKGLSGEEDVYKGRRRMRRNICMWNDLLFVLKLIRDLIIFWNVVVRNVL